jgi:hypothetical protein
LVLLNANSSPLWAIEADISCPRSIAVEQRIVDKPNSWEVNYDEKSNGLKTVTFFDGPPKEMASLVYNHIMEKKKEIIATWDFSPTNERGYWITCSYNDTNAILVKAISSAVKGCQVIYERDPVLAGSVGEIKSIICDSTKGK